MEYWEYWENRTIHKYQYKYINSLMRTTQEYYKLHIYKNINKWENVKKNFLVNGEMKSSGRMKIFVKYSI